MGSQIMSALPRDVRLIVDWYIFESNYDGVKQQYKLLWIGSRNDKHKTYWSKNRQLFQFRSSSNMTTYVANWRWYNGYVYRKIFSFEDRNTSIASLPLKY